MNTLCLLALVIATYQCDSLVLNDRCSYMDKANKTLHMIEFSHFGWLRGSHLNSTSVSDGNGYNGVVSGALNSDDMFKTFKQHPAYTSILEHVDKNLGSEYINVLQGMSPDMMTPEFFLELAKQNSVGNPITALYPQPVGTISPTMLRYWKQTSDLAWLFASLNGKSVAEIGVGYGGLSHAILTRFPDLRSYTYADLPAVEKLALKVMGVVLPQDTIKLALYNTNNGTMKEDTFDLCISNYAFSELSPEVADLYIDKILQKCRSGYMVWNDMRITRKEYIPKIEQATGQKISIAEEVPNTCACNKVLIWGIAEPFPNRQECWMKAQVHPTVEKTKC